MLLVMLVNQGQVIVKQMSNYGPLNFFAANVAIIIFKIIFSDGSIDPQVDSMYVTPH